MTSVPILVTVGSDHHPFDRLIGWVDDWLGRHADLAEECVIQHGTAAAPRNGRAYAYLPHDELQRFLRDAEVVVTQGGPMGIVESRRSGTKPIVVPRLARLGEVVDDHQVAFCRKLSETGDLVLAEDPSSVWSALDLALATPGVYGIERDVVDDAVRRAVDRFASLVADLPRRRRLLPRLPRRSRPSGG